MKLFVFIDLGHNVKAVDVERKDIDGLRCYEVDARTVKEAEKKVFEQHRDYLSDSIPLNHFGGD